MQELIPGKLYSFDEKVRVEIGPQVIELTCCDENLSDEVTAPHYKIGGRDANGKLIRPDELPQDQNVKKIRARDKVLGIPEVAKGEKMACVDWRSKHVPHIWKIYQLQETAEVDELGETVFRFVKVDDIPGKEDALAVAQELYEGMS